MGQNDDHIRGEDEDLSQTLNAGKPLYVLGGGRAVEIQAKFMSPK